MPGVATGAIVIADGVMQFPTGQAFTWTGAQTFNGTVTFQLTTATNGSSVTISPDVVGTGVSTTLVSGLSMPASTLNFVTTNQTGDYLKINLGTDTINNPNVSATITNAATLKIVGAPIAGTNTTLTNRYALWISTAGAGGNVFFAGKFVKYNNITTTGTGVPIIVATVSTGVVTGTQTNAINYTPPAAVGQYIITVSIDNTSSTNTGTNTITVVYKNTNGTSITQTVALQSTAGAFGTTSTGASTSFTGSFPFSIDNSATAITLTSTSSGTVSYQLDAGLMQIN